jgi:hypothetical protein
LTTIGSIKIKFLPSLVLCAFQILQFWITKWTSTYQAENLRESGLITINILELGSQPWRQEIMIAICWELVKREWLKLLCSSYDSMFSRRILLLSMYKIKHVGLQLALAQLKVSTQVQCDMQGMNLPSAAQQKMQLSCWCHCKAYQEVAVSSN